MYFLYLQKKDFKLHVYTCFEYSIEKLINIEKHRHTTNKKPCDTNKTIESREPGKDNQTQVLQMPTIEQTS